MRASVLVLFGRGYRAGSLVIKTAGPDSAADERKHKKTGSGAALRDLEPQNTHREVSRGYGLLNGFESGSPLQILEPRPRAPL